jgi:hypothetical protein
VDCDKVFVLSCLCLLDAIVELHAMDGKRFNDSLIGKYILYEINDYLI